jgi:antitoxin component YwqK of YwqJK toxin-antitoxin module
MYKRLFFIIVLLTFSLPVYSEEIIMKWEVVSEKPKHIEEEKYYLGNKVIATRKYDQNIKKLDDLKGENLFDSQESRLSSLEPHLIESKGEIPNGIVKQFYKSGKLLREWNYKDGKRNGLAKAYFENGKVASEGIYIEGKKQGELKTYYQSGVLKETQNFVEGVIEGVTKQYNEDGKLIAELTRDRDQMGWWKEKTYDYFPNDNLKYEYVYDQKASEGSRKDYYENGKVLLEANFKGLQMTDCKNYDQSGNMISTVCPKK